MSLTGTTNTSAQTALRYLTQNQATASSSLAKLSSGSRIVKASDDAASLAVGTKLKADVTALKQAAVNAGQASSLLQVADGGMAKVADILQRMKALAVQAQSGSVTDNERAFLDREYQQLIDQVDAIAEQTKFNGRGLINGAAGKTLTQTFSTSAVGISALLSGNAAAAAYELSYAYTAGSSLGQFTLTDTSSTIAHTVQFTHAATAVVYEGRIRFDTAGLQINLSNFDFTATFAGTDAALTVADASTNGRPSPTPPPPATRSPPATRWIRRSRRSTTAAPPSVRSCPASSSPRPTSPPRSRTSTPPARPSSTSTWPPR